MKLSSIAVFVLLSGLLFVACDRDAEYHAVQPPPPSMTGTWDCSMIRPIGFDTAVVVLYESDDQLSGTLTWGTTTRQLTGTYVDIDSVAIGSQDSTLRILIQGGVNTMRTLCSGTIDFWDITKTPEMWLGYYLITMNKRL